MIQEGAYRRLIDQYYAREAPLPADMAECYKLARATTAAGRHAVDIVIAKFFKFCDRGFSQKRCDELIAEFKNGEPLREQKRVARNERKQRSRERRQKLFEQLRDQGVTAKYDATITELEELLSRVTSHTGHENGHGNGHTGHAPVTPNVTVTGTVTQSQSPIPNPQSHIPNPLPPFEKGVTRQRRSPERADRDEGRARWTALLKSGGAERDARVQAAIDAVGGWSAIAQRTEREEPVLIRRFCEAWRQAAAPT